LAVDDTTCDHVDDNCDGRDDEDAVCEPDAGADAGMPVDAGRGDDAGSTASAGSPNQPAPDEDAAANGGSGGKHGGGAGGEDAGTLLPIDHTAVGEENTGKGCACTVPGQGSRNAPWALIATGTLLGLFAQRRRRRTFVI
jgi:hypothetical protein